MKTQWFIFTLVFLLVGCTNANTNPGPKPKVLPVIDYKRLITPVNEDLANPPSIREIAQLLPHDVNNPYLLQLERLSDYRDYIDRSINALEIKLDRDRRERSKARDSLSDKVFDCSLPLMQQVDLGERPRARETMASLTEKDIAHIALDYAEKMKAYNELSLAKLAEAAEQYALACN